MPEPQPGADRPADGSTRATGRERDPADEPTDSPVPPPAGPTTGPDDTPVPTDDSTPTRPETVATDDPAPTGPAAVDAPSDARTGETGPAGDEGPAASPPAGNEALRATGSDAATGATQPASPTPVTPARGSAAVPARGEPAGSAPAGPPDPTRVESRPDPTRVESRPDPTRVDAGPEQPAPRWSGSAAVPPPPPRKRGWGESAEPTPVPPAPVESPEHQVPVDPWAGADTGGWELHSVDFPALPPTLPYPAPPHTLPYPGPPVAPPPGPPVAPAPAAARPVSPSPAPVSPARPSPPAPQRPPKQRRGQTPPPATPPPGWQAPKGYVAVPVRRRRRWPWLLLLTVACCCGVPLWWLQPLSTQYPASATLPDRVGDLRLREDERSQATAEQLETEVRQAHLLAEETFAGVYSTDDGKRVILFGGTGLRLDPEGDADAELTRLTERYALDPAVPVETGVRGRYERCAVGRADGDAVVVCTSVDHGSLATGVFTRLSVDDSGGLLNTLRQQVVTPDQS